MRRLNLSEWAAIGELAGTLAVIISLAFVIYSINQNTAALQGSTENLIFERNTALTSQIMLDPSLAQILVKMRAPDPELTEVEAVRWEKYQLNMLDVWALAYNRHKHDLLADEQWEAWDRYFTQVFKTGGERLSMDQWEDLRYGYADDFWEHVRESLFATR